MNKKKLLAFAASTAMFAACGDDVTEINEIHQDGMAVLEKGETLSEQLCNTANVGEMLFVMDSSEAFICDGESWQTLKGADGADGKDGANGKDGADGKDGEKGADGESGKSTDSGKDGSDGTSCSAKPLTNGDGRDGVEISCGGIAIDTLWSGKDGENAVGKDGEDGENCTLEDDGNGSVTVTCGEGKSVTLFKAACGTKPYDPSKLFCMDSELYELCGGKNYNPSKSFCADGSIYDLCNGESFKPDSNYCKNGAVAKIYHLCCDEVSNPSKCRRSLNWYDERTHYCTKDFYIKEYDQGVSQLVDSRDGNVYKTVKIGDQVWMAENLNYAYTGVKFNYKDKTSDSTSWCYDNKIENCAKYGRLYTWAAAIDSVALTKDSKNPQICGYGADDCVLPTVVRGVCPEGWHLPSVEEWRKLAEPLSTKIDEYTDHWNYFGAGIVMKTAEDWESLEGTTPGTNASGFTALPAGSIDMARSGGFGESVNFWSASLYDNDTPYYFWLTYKYDDAFVLSSQHWSEGFSVRCIKDSN
ncbi:FISUMP domain-containing protein [Fibrobacter sp.]|uniref:FISUMP domain-containing protein n=1 Tax=Fibrobacter sp. TaxID=35828 RepID=UPI00388E16C3